MAYSGPKGFVGPSDRGRAMAGMGASRMAGGSPGGMGRQGGYGGPKGFVGPSDRGLQTAGMNPSGFAGRLRDYNDQDNSTMDNVGNFLARMVGFNEMRPSAQYSTQGRANWGFDPAGLIGSIAGTAAGMPFGGGLLADLLSQGAGRPMQMAMGPDVFGGGGGGMLSGPSKPGMLNGPGAPSVPSPGRPYMQPPGSMGLLAMRGR